MEGWTPAAAVYVGRKRPLESGRPAFVAREDGAYHVLEMPKKHRCGCAANPRRARSHLLTGDDGAACREKKKKRELELGEPEFVAQEEENGAYAILEMPKKYKCDYMADPERSNSAFTNALDAEDARLLAMSFREMSVKYKQQAP